MMNRLLTFMVTVVLTVLSYAQPASPVKVNASFKEVSATEGVLTFVASINSGWHMYSTQVVQYGPTPTTINVERISGAKLDGPLKTASAPIKQYEEQFEADVYYFEKAATFTQKVKLTGGKYEIAGFLEYGACNDHSCTPPTSVEFDFKGEVKPSAAEVVLADDKSKDDADGKDAKDIAKEEDQSAVTVTSDTALAAADTTSSDTSTVSKATVGDTDLWAPVDVTESKEDASLWYLFALGFFGGLLAIVTPCVWPIIPMTVSFFMKRGTTRKSTEEEKAAAKKRGMRDAILYGVSIVVIYVVLGLAITLISGASALNDLATNAVFNIIFFLMLLLFGASFIGGFELTLPSKWNNAVEKKASTTTGLLSIFLMAFTLVLVSFSCTGPIIGFMLVEVVTSSIVGPVVGMLGFSIALALPFTIFAMFPTLLKNVPKSGGWMNVVKVTLGFIELAFSLKFLSVADLVSHWGILDRETFLSIWIVLFMLLGAYLVGWIRLPHDEDEYDDEGNVIVRPKTSVPRLFLAIASFAFAVYMIPGLWGAPLKAVSAFAPPIKTQDFNLSTHTEVKPMFTDYEEGMKYAAEHGRPVMIDFTGYGCVNCRYMEASVFTDPTVAKIMTEDYVLIQLYVDDKTRLPEPVDVTVAGKPQRLRTVGNKWSYLQDHKFGANAQPFYVLLDTDGKPLAPAYSYDEDIDKFTKWLKGGLDRFSE